MQWPFHPLITWYHVTFKNCYISTSMRPINIKLGRMMPYAEKFLLTMPSDLLILWSRDITWHLKLVISTIPWDLSAGWCFIKIKSIQFLHFNNVVLPDDLWSSCLNSSNPHNIPFMSAWPIRTTLGRILQPTFFLFCSQPPI